MEEEEMKQLLKKHRDMLKEQKLIERIKEVDTHPKGPVKRKERPTGKKRAVFKEEATKNILHPPCINESYFGAQGADETKWAVINQAIMVMEESKLEEKKTNENDDEDETDQILTM